MNKQIKFKPIALTSYTISRILEEKNSDALALYTAYFEIADWQKTHKVYATESFMRKRLNLGQVRFRKAKKILQKLGIIIPHNGGRAKKSYIEVLHLVDSSVEVSPSINSSAISDPQVLSTNTKVLSIEKEVLKDEEPFTQLKSRFNKIRQTYKTKLKGKTKGFDTEFENAIKKHDLTMELLERIAKGAKAMYLEKKEEYPDGDFQYVPMFQTFINQSQWEMYEKE